VRTTTPRIAGVLARAVAALDALLDRAYGSRWNPAHQSGSLAVALMLVATATGVYLLFVYRIGSPYESMQAIQAQAWGGRWLRALHRYASDLAVAAVAFHALRMLAEGRSWGPRVLAWVTGLLLTGLMLVVGWTGYVLVWDEHGRLLGAAGARLMDSLRVLATPIGRIFGGAAPAPPSFFFLNLFVHMALPLAMTLLLWVHTLRLARSRWLPDRRLWLGATAALTLLSVLWPATLGPAADGLTLGDRAAYDVFYTAWIPLAARVPAAAAWAATLGLVLLPLTLPLWWRPARARQAERSKHNPLACTGCGQCVLDCPFEAIAMVPNTTGRGTHTEIAFVNVARCVSCGLCAGSCDQLAIGPPGRDGHAQVQSVRPLVADPDPRAVVLVHCAHDGVAERLAARARVAGARVRTLEVDCVGSLHMLPVQQLADGHHGVFVLGCAAGRCRSREGVALALGRLLQGREPFLKRPLDATRVRFASGGASDLRELERELVGFVRDSGARAAPEGLEAGRRRGLAGWLAAALLTALALAATGWLSQLPAGSAPADGAVRLSWRLPGQSWLDCRPLSAGEIARLPAHMRRTEDCRTVYLHYRLRAWVDGELRLDRAVAPLGARGDRPLYVEEDLHAGPGQRRVRVEFTPVDDPRGAGLRLELEEEMTLQPGRARLVTYDADARRLRAR
jgi:ferredoxin/coenzyme F420-reducing hydrogenase delta subunit